MVASFPQYAILAICAVQEYGEGSPFRGYLSELQRQEQLVQGLSRHVPGGLMMLDRLPASMTK